jgi:Protein of unknown function (DUF3105)
MSSRQQQKEQRRQERLAAEKAEADRKERQQRMLWIGGGVLAVIAIAAVIVAVVAGGGGGNDKPKDPNTGEELTPSAPKSGAAIPAAAETNLQTAAKNAGCTLKTFESEGREHNPDPKSWKYKTNPPTSGTHNPTWAEDGVYAFGKAPPVGFTVHALEHGRIDIQYGPKLTKPQFDQLQALMAEDQGYHQLLFKNQTNMPGTIAATAWTQQMLCPTMNNKVFDAIRDFKARYTDQGPEAVP